MSLGNYLTTKERSQAFQPLLLCEFTFVDGTIYRASTHPLSQLYGGLIAYGYGGHDWEPRVVNQKIDVSQAMSDIGFDIPPSAEVVLADPDGYLKETFEYPQGFKGATLRMYAVMWDAGNTLQGSFTVDSPTMVKFIGLCSTPELDDANGTITVSARSLLNVLQSQLPGSRVQMLCSNTFPTTLKDREAGLTDPSSLFYGCGYSPDLGGVGNFESGTAVFTFCPYTRNGGCDLRLGQVGRAIHTLDQDEFGRDTGRFAGFTYTPNSSSGLQRSYTSGNWEEVINASTSSKYGNFVPMAYGTTWLQPEVMGMYGDGNYTDMEILICRGKVNRIHKVLVNGYEIRELSGTDNRIPSDAYTSSFVNGWWGTINNGFRNGAASDGPGWWGRGDPYGGHTAIYVSVLKEVAASNSVPDVQILLDGASIRVYDSATTFVEVFSGNPAWILLDVLIKTGWEYADFDIPSIIRTATICDETIFYNSMSGFYQNFFNEVDSPPYKRYEIGFYIKTRVSVPDVIRGIRNSMSGILFFDFYTGKLTLGTKQTIASQQPLRIVGSNYDTPYSSVTVQGASAVGYLAYKFDRTSIAKDRNGKSTLRVYSLGNADSPNKITVKFQNRENGYVIDSATVIDTEDASRMGGYPISGSFSMVGAQTFDHIRRVVNRYLAETNRGNPRLDYTGSAVGDTGGTMFFDFQSSFKGIHLTVGQICGIDYQFVKGVTSLVPIRIIRIQPSMNFETVNIVGMYHNDNWYQDTFGQVQSPGYGNQGQVAMRPPYAWIPGAHRANVDDVYYDFDSFFKVVPVYKLVVGDQKSAYIDILGVPPVNTFGTNLQPPRIAPRASYTPSGASDAWPAGNYSIALGQYQSTSAGIAASPLSLPASVRLSAPGYINVAIQNWADTGTTGCLVCVGSDPLNMYWGLDNVASMTSASPGAALLTAQGFFDSLHQPPPDELFNNFRFRVQQEIWPGVCSAMVTASSYSGDGTGDTTLSLSGTVDGSWVGRELMIAGFAPDNLDLLTDPYVPVANLRILSAGGSSVTVQGNPLSNGVDIKPDDMVVVRFKPSFGADSTGPYVDDGGMASPFHPAGWPSNSLIGAQVYIIAGTGRGTFTTILSNTSTRCYVKAWPVQPDTTSKVVILDSSIQIDQSAAPSTNALLNFRDVAPLPSFRIEVTPMQRKMLFVQAFTCGQDGSMSPPALSPFREVYIMDGSIDIVLVNGVGGPGNLG